MSFYAVFDRIAPAGNKYMAVLWNNAQARRVVVNRIYRFNWQVAAVTGVMLEQELREITARTTVGTQVPIQLEDISDPPLTSGIECSHNASGVTESGGRGLLRRFFAVSDEMLLASTNLVKDLALSHDTQLIYWRRPGSRGHVIPTGRGLVVKNITASTVGSVSYVFEFDDEPVIT